MEYTGSWNFYSTYYNEWYDSTMVNLRIDYTIWQNSVSNATVLQLKVYQGGYECNISVEPIYIRYKMNSSDTNYSYISGYMSYDGIYSYYSPTPSGKLLYQDTIYVPHKANGEAPDIVQIGFSGHYQTQDNFPNNYSYSENIWDISYQYITNYFIDIDRSSTVSATSGYIGNEITINIGRYSDALTHTLKYTFGNLNGTIVEKTASTSYKWVLPSSFYNELVKETSKKGNIICETYDGNTYVGYNAAVFTASVDPATNAPIITPVVVDVNSTTIALTGDANKLIRYESLANFETRAVAQNGATIVSQSVTCGSVTKKDFAIGTIENVESGTFVFTATDSRGLTTTKTIEKPIINYVKPTCNQEVETTLVDTTSAIISLTISGNYFNGNFGTTNNTYLIEVRYPNADGELGEWTALPEVMFPTIGNNTYTLDIEINNLSYSQSYNVQSRITDKLHTAQSSVYTVKVLPVYDWSKDDFNFNVPVNMNGETVLRHNSTANNLVVSASGGSIYFRPAGTNSTGTEMQLNPQGDLVLNGTIKVNGIDIIAALEAKGII